MLSMTKRFVTTPLGLPREFGYKPFVSRIFGVPTLNISERRLAELVLVTLSEQLSGKAGNRAVAEGLFGTSMLYEDGEYHRHLRSITAHLYEGTSDQIETAARESTQRICSVYASASPPRLLTFFLVLAVDITCRHFLDIKPSSLLCMKLSREIDSLGKGLYATKASKQSGSRYQRGLTARRLLDDFLQNHFPNKFSEKLAILGLSDTEIRDHSLSCAPFLAREFDLAPVP